MQKAEAKVETSEASTGFIADTELLSLAGKFTLQVFCIIAPNEFRCKHIIFTCKINLYHF